MRDWQALRQRGLRAIDAKSRMKLTDLLHLLRIGLGLVLVGASLYLGYLSTLLLDMGNFRTEGSPAGSIMFVVLMMAPFAAIAALVCGLFLLLAGRWMRPPPPYDPGPAVQAVARREELWHRHPRGALLGALVNGDFAVLRFQPSAAERGVHSRQTGYRGKPEATYPFRCADGDLVQLPTAWTIPTALALKALQQFEQSGEQPSFIAWESYAETGAGDQVPSWRG